MLKSFTTNDPKYNPFTEFINDEQFAHMLASGFKTGTLDCYANLTGDIVYCKSQRSSCNWIINIYITESGIAVDHDYECGGNSSNWTWWFTETPTRKPFEMDYSNGQPKEVEIKIYSEYTFEGAWNKMIDHVKTL